MAEPNTWPEAAKVQFNCTGTAVGKMRNELAVQMVQPFEEEVHHIATDEGSFHGGEASAPPPLALFVAGLTGCLMTQIRAFARRLGVTLDDLRVETRVIWDWRKTGRTYETAPNSFEIDVLIESPDSTEKVAALIAAAQKGCFLEQTLGRANTLRHRLKRGGSWIDL
ncbi:OsmC-related (seleno)protein [Seohaeicola nanhaiensis]|uniref:OsmC-related (Seleno)protein n=1 Tax=Seohaeicola nanhaiensis TaxID=1387282 RepID=A0ABV9KNG8_9RHOB